MNKFWDFLLSWLKNIKLDQPQKTNSIKHEDNKEEAVDRVVVDFDSEILYVDVQKGLNVRKEPEVKDNKIDGLLFGERVVVIEKKDRWYKISYRDGKEGWVVCEYLSEENPKTSTSKVKKELSNNPPIIFEIGRPNLATSDNTKRVREIIDQEFHHTEASGVDLQCVEYVQYKVKINTGVKINWPSDRPRDGGKWSGIFRKNNLYKVLDQPVVNSAMSFANPNFNKPWGHVAFVEEAFDDGSIRITEANWPRNGMYNDRILSKEQWSQDGWGAEFIDFT